MRVKIVLAALAASLALPGAALAEDSLVAKKVLTVDQAQAKQDRLVRGTGKKTWRRATLAEAKAAYNQGAAPSLTNMQSGAVSADASIACIPDIDCGPLPPPGPVCRIVSWIVPFVIGDWVTHTVLQNVSSWCYDGAHVFYPYHESYSWDTDWSMGECFNWTSDPKLVTLEHSNDDTMIAWTQGYASYWTIFGCGVPWDDGTNIRANLRLKNNGDADYLTTGP